MTDFLFGGMVQANTPINITSALVAANVSVTGSGIPTNGVFLSAANTLAFATNSTQQMVIDTNGNMGIGTATPVNNGGGSQTLTINGAVVGIFQVQANGVNAGQMFSRSANNLTLNAPNANISLETGNTERMRITANGNIEIGATTQTTNPTAGLVINNINGGGTEWVNNNNGGGNVSALSTGGLAFGTFTGAVGSESITERMRITNAGNISTTGNIAIGNVSGPYNSGTGRAYLTVQGSGVATSTGAGIIQLATNAAGSTNPYPIGNIEWHIPDNTSSTGTRVGFITMGGLGASANNTGSYMHFATKADGVAGVGAVGMMLTGVGNLLIGTTTAPGAGNGNATVVIQGVGTNGGGIELVGGAAGGSNIYALNGGGMVFSTYTGAVGSEVSTGRMLINSTGQLIVGNSTGGTLLTAALVVTSSGSQPQIQVAYNSGTNGFIVQQTSSGGGVKLYNGDNSELTLGTNNTERMRITALGNVGIGSTTPTQLLDVQGNVNVLNTVIMGSSFLRNRIINGGMAIDQRNSGASQTITAGAALAYTVDRFYAYCTGANVTGSRIANSTNNPANNPSQYAYQFAGAASVTGIGFGTRIEAINCWDLAGTTATLSVNLANGLLTTVTWTASYANSTDSFGSLASPTVTQIATGTFTVNASLSRYSVSIPIPIAATTGIQIVFTVGAQTSQTWQINNVQLEPGPVATPFERKLYNQTLADCQRYYLLIGDGTLIASGYLTNGNYLDAMVRWPVTMRASPTVTVNGTWNVSGNNGQPTVSLSGASGASLRVTATATGQVYATVSGGSGTPTLSANAEL